MAEKSKSNVLNLQPQSLEAEQAVLGSMLISKEAVSKVLQWITTEHFYKDAHGKIFATMISLFNENEPVDTIQKKELGSDLCRCRQICLFL